MQFLLSYFHHQFPGLEIKAKHAVKLHFVYVLIKVVCISLNDETTSPISVMKVPLQVNYMCNTNLYWEFNIYGILKPLYCTGL